MSELIISQTRADKRLQLLASVSALTLLAVSVTQAKAEDATRPTVWIEGGWHFDAVTGSGESYTPPLDALTKAGGFSSLTDIEDRLGYSGGAEGSITFQPTGSDWTFKIAGRYSRVRSALNVHQEKDIIGPPMKKFILGTIVANQPFTPSLMAYTEQSVVSSESHAIVDFQVGKDVGIGLLGRGTESVISFGARYAQLNAKSSLRAYAAPDAHFEQYSFSSPFFGNKYHIRTSQHASAARVERYSSLRAFGPSLSWSNTTALFGDTAEGQLVFDWGVNAALLFGRQKSKVTQQSMAEYKHVATSPIRDPLTAAPVTHTRSRMVTIPNLGGFAGISYRFTNAKLSAGYRADFFFNATDRGLASRDAVTTGTHGPFATISVGL
ncbi:MAG TPA: hypothetical protein VGM36_03170 [Rhizomicrobium sp.]|jgi:hypothetical protein